MKHNRNVAEWLKTYEIVQPEETQITECIQQMQKVMQVKQIQRANSLCFFIETQMKFMKSEILFSFCLSVGLMLVLQIFKLLLKVPFTMDISVGIAPFLVVPIIRSIAKSKREGMLELETASKLGLHRIVTVRTIINYALAIIMISLIWMASSVDMENFVLNRLLISLISFEITSICFLWFGKASVYAGIFSAAAWMVMMWFLLAWEEAVFWMWKVNSMILGLIMVLMIGISMIVLYGYVQNLSFESEEKKWNFE